MRLRKRWFKSALVCLLLAVLLVSCGSQTPKPLLLDALSYQRTHSLGDEQSILVGNTVLVQSSKLRDIKVNSEKTITITDADGKPYSGVRVTGTYTVEAQPKGRRSRFKQRGEPFDINLARLSNETTDTTHWLLAYPPQANSAAETWQLVDFLPTTPAADSQQLETAEPQATSRQEEGDRPVSTVSDQTQPTETASSLTD